MRYLLQVAAGQVNIHAAAGFFVALNSCYHGAVLEDDRLHHVKRTDLAARSQDGINELLVIQRTRNRTEVRADSNTAPFGDVARRTQQRRAEENAAALIG